MNYATFSSYRINEGERLRTVRPAFSFSCSPTPFFVFWLRLQRIQINRLVDKWKIVEQFLCNGLGEETYPTYLNSLIPNELVPLKKEKKWKKNWDLFTFLMILNNFLKKFEKEFMKIFSAPNCLKRLINTKKHMLPFPLM